MVAIKASLVALSLVYLVHARPGRMARRTYGAPPPPPQQQQQQQPSYGGSGYNGYDGGSGGSGYEAPPYTPPPQQQTENNSSYYEPPAAEPPMAEAPPPPMYEPPMTTTTAAAAAATYGSGYAPWNNPSYDGCIQQCVAQYGPPPTMYTPPPMPEGQAEVQAPGGGKIWDVIVAPKQGVLRYVPFAVVGAAPGDVVRFRWGGKPHTVTKADVLFPCNATLDAPFTSGKQETGFVFERTINDTKPVYFYCGVADHCQKGMFGVINPPAGAVGDTGATVESMMNSMAESDPQFQAKMAYVVQQTQNSSVASNWGASLLMTDIPADRQAAYLDNVLYTRLAMAQNPEFIQGSNLNIGTSPIKLPDQDINALFASAETTSTTSTSTTSTGAPVPTSGALDSSSSYGSGASRLGVSTGVAFAVVFVATLLF